MRSARVLIGVLLAVGLCGTGCGNQVSATSPAPVTSSSTPTATKVKTSTPQQLASVVAEHNTNVEQIDLDEDCRLYEYNAEGNPKAFTDNIAALSCSIGKQTHAIRAQILVRELSELAPYPTELDSLVSDTKAKAEVLAAIRVNDACDSQSTVSDACRQARLEYSLAAPSLESTLARWKPYGA